MVKTCILCRKEKVPNDGRSFHRFPSNVVLKEKWKLANNLIFVSRNSEVCSDHFDESCFHKTDGYTFKRRLLATAIPVRNRILKTQNSDFANNIENSRSRPSSKLNNKKYINTDVSTKESAPSNKTIGSTTVECINISNNEVINHNIKVEFDDDTTIPYEIIEHSIKVEWDDGKKNKIDNSLINSEYTDICNKVVDHNIKVECIDDTKSIDSNEIIEANIKVAECNDEINKTDTMSSCERNVPYDAKLVEKIRFKSGFKTEYISENDFVSNESWERFLRYRAYEIRKLKASQNRTARKQKVIGTMKDVLIKVNKHYALDAAE